MLKDMWYRCTIARFQGFRWDPTYMPKRQGKFVMKMVKKDGDHRRPLAGTLSSIHIVHSSRQDAHDYLAALSFCSVIPFIFLNRMPAQFLPSVDYCLDGTYDVTYPGTSHERARIVVKNHAFLQKRATYPEFIDMNAHNRAQLTWNSNHSIKQRTTWSGTHVPHELVWSTTHPQYHTIKWTLVRGSRPHPALYHVGRKLFNHAVDAHGPYAMWHDDGGGRGHFITHDDVDGDDTHW